MYQFFPASLKKDVVERILLHSLTEDGSFTTLSLLLNAEIRSDSKVSGVFELHEVLESANFAKFWSLYKASDASKRVPSLHSKVQQLVLDVVSLTYQRIDKKLLFELCGVSSDAELTPILKSGWLIEGETVRVPLQAHSQGAQAKGASTEQQQRVAILQALKR